MKQRLITGIIAGALFLGLCLLGGLWYQLLILAMALIGYYEFVRMTKVNPFGGTSLVGYLGIIMFVFPYDSLGIEPWLPLQSGIWLLMFVFMVVTVVTKNQIPIGTAAMMFLGSLYVGIGFAYIAESRLLPHGIFWTFLLFCCIWASDAGAYFVGKMIGKIKLWPSISPNKTVEGALGGVVLSIVVAVVFALSSGGILTFGRALFIGIACAVIGQLGDLVQSAYKRVYGIKDSGNLLPGHGGILDRCDSWIAVFPFVHMLMLLPY
ncbi:phosphatidate cytidylyltransferase [Paenibacillus sp. JX-17]|uniref:Phosphatidate cytidylyltransferase n=1 Tax=Paenibacillus lacisoli TaxID=3064525 RepID=A0ABT9C972_9BACL|nr:phosphatidate cytidylyltransferase [Paenibacillus sp. JX-17]MDO7905797.1 phosphatidate cytidylyltransferase [Paenibacillus sp. JX-17]